MDVEHFNAQTRGFDRGLGYSIGNVVKLEIEENFSAELLNQSHRLGPRIRKELLADLEHANFRNQQPDQLFNFFQIVEIESDNQTLSHGEAGTDQLEVGCHALTLNCLGDYTV